MTDGRSRGRPERSVCSSSSDVAGSHRDSSPPRAHCSVVYYSSSFASQSPSASRRVGASSSDFISNEETTGEVEREREKSSRNCRKPLRASLFRPIAEHPEQSWEHELWRRMSDPPVDSPREQKFPKGSAIPCFTEHCAATSRPKEPLSIIVVSTDISSPSAEDGQTWTDNSPRSRKTPNGPDAPRIFPSCNPKHTDLSET